MAAGVEATTREMSQSLISPDKPSLPGDTGKPALGPKPHLMPKPFALQRNATVRPIKAPKFNKQLNRASSSEMILDITKSGAGNTKPLEPLKPASNGTVNGSNQSAASKPIPLSPKPDLTAKPKPETTKNPGSNNQTGPNSNPGVTAEDVKGVQLRSRAKSFGSLDQKILDQEDQEEAAKTEANVKAPSRCWPPRNRLSMELTSKFESQSQTKKEVRKDAEISKLEKERPPQSPSESKFSKLPVEKGETGDEEVSGGSIRRRISLLFDQSAAAQRRDTINKKDNPLAEISVDIKQRIKDLSLDAPRIRLPSTGGPKSPPSEKTQSNSDEPQNERSSVKPSETEKVPADKPPSMTEIKNVEEKEDDEDENYVPIPVYGRVGVSLDVETKKRQEEEKQRKDEQRERERLLEEERKAREMERHKEEERKRAEEERKQKEEKQRQMEEKRKQEEEQKRRIEEERKEEERRRQAEEEKRRIEEEKERLKKESEMEEERRRIQELVRQREEERLRQEQEKEERLKKEREMEERKRMEEERLKEEERLRQEQELERLKKEKEMEEEKRRIQELERQKEDERLRQEREMERVRKEIEEERKREEERLRQERERERLKKEKEMEEERRRIQEMERLKEEERLKQEQEKERLRKEMEERLRIQEFERQKEEERLRKERELERIRKEKEMEEERRRIQELERQKEEERLRKEREIETLRKEKEMEEERQRIQELERQKELERLRKEREIERLRKDKEMEEERRRIQELERQKEEERLRQEREMERIRKEREMEERKRMEEERQREEERLMQERERLRKEKEMEEERRRIQELERQKEEERLRQEWEKERLHKERKQMEEERQREEERLRKEREMERLKEEQLRLERENEMQTYKVAERLREVPTSYDLISFDAEKPASQTRVSTVQAADVSPRLPEVIYDDFSVKPRRWGTGARRSRTPSPSRESPAAPDYSLQPESKSSHAGSQEPSRDQGHVHDLFGFEPEASSPRNSTENRVQRYLFEEETEFKPEDLLEPETDEGQLKDGEPEEDQVAEHRDTDTENLIGETDEQSENNETVDDHAAQIRINQALQRLTQVKQRNTSTGSDTADIPVQEELEPLPVLESAAPLLDSSVFRSKVDLGKKRSIKRARPTRAVRQRAGLPALTEGTQPDWRFCDSTDAKDQCSNGAGSESEEEPSRDVTSSPAPSQPKRVPVFPGLDPSALMAQLKRRSGVVETESPTEAQTPPSVSARTPRTPNRTLGPRVLPPVDAKDSGSGSSPSWLLELKSKKRISQPESDA
ncbi:182 kDa tankyrase-1-binding protein [Garra rufa]|uniref:182 kDa tankyrase-1-binding protein n=1 Tax=Garra rufa TaxID=137080 RepID=UPI003CCE5A3D